MKNTFEFEYLNHDLQTLKFVKLLFLKNKQKNDLCLPLPEGLEKKFAHENKYRKFI